MYKHQSIILTQLDAALTHLQSCATTSAKTVIAIPVTGQTQAQFPVMCLFVLTYVLKHTCSHSLMQWEVLDEIWPPNASTPKLAKASTSKLQLNGLELFEQMVQLIHTLSFVPTSQEMIK